MNIGIPNDTRSSWVCFSHVPGEISTAFPEGQMLPSGEAELKVDGENIIVTPADLVIPVLQKIFGRDPRVCEHYDLDQKYVQVGSKRYKLGYVNDISEHDYGWYFV